MAVPVLREVCDGGDQDLRPATAAFAAGAGPELHMAGRQGHIWGLVFEAVCGRESALPGHGCQHAALSGLSCEGVRRETEQRDDFTFAGSMGSNVLISVGIRLILRPT